VVQDIARDHSGFIFKDQQLKTAQSPQMLQTTRSVTLHHMSEDFSALPISSFVLNPTTEHDTYLCQVSSILI